ncbi:hypothetical protein JCM33374_g2857 [Metschnikowia sp. JCM 33374]|nr:hypothetical protein JCM33374_g2857 [Metschnikowia sp. JCM 33374]
MKFSTPLIFGAFAALASAAPAPETIPSTNGTLIPQEAIISGLTIPEDVLPVFNYEDGAATVVFLNTTILDEAKASNKQAKRDLASEEALQRRDAEAGKWHWVSLGLGQPMFKRDAEAEAEAGKWHWVALGLGQPMFKRDAEAGKWHWVSLGLGQPMFKRDAEADAEAGKWHWVSLGLGQPFF